MIEDGQLAPSINDIAETARAWTESGPTAAASFRLDLRAAPAGGFSRSPFQHVPVGGDPVTNRVNVVHRDPAGILWAGTDGSLFPLNDARGERVFAPIALGLAEHPDIQVQVWTLAIDRPPIRWPRSRRRRVSSSIR